MAVIANGPCGRNVRVSLVQRNKQDIERVTLPSQNVEVILVTRNPQFLKSGHVLDSAIVSYIFFPAPWFLPQVYKF